MGVLLAALVLGGSDAPMAVAKRMAAEYRRATVAKDFASFEKGSTPDFTYIDGKGNKMAKAGAMAGMRQMYATAKFDRVEVKAVSAKRAEGGVLYVQDSTTVAHLSMGGPKPSRMEMVSRDEVLVVKKGGRWLTKRVRNLKDATKIDGKPMKGM